MDILKYIPIAINLSHLLPDVQRVIELTRPIRDNLVRLWPDLKPVLLRIANDPKVRELVASGGPAETGLLLGIRNVRWLQRSLAALGFPPDGGIDGTYGPGTVKAVEAMQKASGLEPDGWAGPETSALILYELIRRGLPVDDPTGEKK